MSWNCSLRSGMFTELRNGYRNGTRISDCSRMALNLTIIYVVSWVLPCMTTWSQRRRRHLLEWVRRVPGSASADTVVSQVPVTGQSRAAAAPQHIAPQGLKDSSCTYERKRLDCVSVYVVVCGVNLLVCKDCGLGFFWWNFRQRNENFWILMKLILETGTELSWAAVVLDTPRRRTLKFSKHLK